MDEVANRAQTSKRSLYAHFESKEKLLLGGAYATKPADALVAFCGRYLEAMLYESAVQVLRISMADGALPRGRPPAPRPHVLPGSSRASAPICGRRPISAPTRAPTPPSA